LPKVLITGATGNVGRRVTDLLVAEGKKVVAVSRHAATAEFPSAVSVVQGNPSEPQTLTSAFDGIEAVLISPRAVGAATSELLRLAIDRGVQRAVVLSALTVEYGGGDKRFAEEFRTIEGAVKASGIRWTVLRSADYASNARGWAPQIRSGDIVRGAYGDAASSTIHEADVASIAALALIDSAHSGRTHVLTGPQSVTQRQKVEMLGRALGRQLSWVEIPADQVRAGMIARGLPEEIPDRMLGYLADHVERAGPSTTTVSDILGRPARTFSQ
jgi:uncharacterized protein YbjT (DUF2867 family)